MTTEKKSAIIYSDWIEQFESLSDEEAGKLIKHLMRYINDLNPKAPDRMTELLFIPIQQCINRDKAKWNERAKRSRTNGHKGGRPQIKEDITQDNLENPVGYFETQETQEVILKPTKPDNDNGNVNVNVNDNVNGNVNVNGNDNGNDNGKSNPEKLDLIFPFDTENFKSAWNNWLQYRSEKRKPLKSILEQQSALKKLSQFDEEFAIGLIETSMGNGWTGLVFEKTKEQYEQYKNSRTKIGKTIDDIIRMRYQ